MLTDFTKMIFNVGAHMVGVFDSGLELGKRCC